MAGSPSLSQSGGGAAVCLTEELALTEGLVSDHTTNRESSERDGMQQPAEPMSQSQHACIVALW